MIKSKAKLCAVLAAVVLACSGVAVAQTEWALQPSPPIAAMHVPSAMVPLLDSQGTRLIHNVSGTAQPICDVWWAKSVDAKAPAAGTPDVLLDKVAVGTFVGLIQWISRDAEDFKDQKLKPGLYSMRYAQVPQNGNHMGVSQYRDFVALSPAAEDVQPDKVLSFDDMVNLSRKSAGTGHPAVLSLTPANPAYKNLPAVLADDQGNCSIQLDLKEAGTNGPTDAKFALLLVTPPKESGGS